METILVHGKYTSYEEPILISIDKIISIEPIYTLDHEEQGTLITTINDNYYNVREFFNNVVELLKRFGNFGIAISEKK